MKAHTWKARPLWQQSTEVGAVPFGVRLGEALPTHHAPSRESATDEKREGTKQALKKQGGG